MRREEEKELPQRFIPFFDPRDYEVPENLSGSEIYPISSVNFRPILRNQMIQISPRIFIITCLRFTTSNKGSFVFLKLFSFCIRNCKKDGDILGELIPIFIQTEIYIRYIYVVYVYI